MPTILLIDASASLAYPTDSMEKWEYARQVALGLAAAAHRSGDPVGIAVATQDGLVRLPPRTRRSVLNEISRVLSGVRPAGSPQLSPAIPLLRNAGRIAIISDFLGDADALIRVAGQLVVSGREVHPIHVLHGDELDPPQKTTLLTDPEDDRVKRPVTSATRQKYLERFGAWREQIARDWRMTGAYYSAVATTEPVARSVRRIAGSHS